MNSKDSHKQKKKQDLYEKQSGYTNPTKSI